MFLRGAPISGLIVSSLLHASRSVILPRPGCSCSLHLIYYLLFALISWFYNQSTDIIVVFVARVISSLLTALTLNQCTLAGPVYTGMPLECHWLTQSTLRYHCATQRMLAGYTGTPLEKLSWNSPTLECHWRNLVESGPHWDATGETLTFTAYTGTPLDGLWQPTHAPTHIVKHAQ